MDKELEFWIDPVNLSSKSTKHQESCFWRYCLRECIAKYVTYIDYYTVYCDSPVCHQAALYRNMSDDSGEIGKWEMGKGWFGERVKGKGIGQRTNIQIP